MNGMKKLVFALGVLCAFAVLSGCKTTETIETTTTTQVTSVATASTESAAVSVSTETTTVTQSTVTQSTTPPPPPPPAVDVLSDMQKPCGTVSPDAPKFVRPDETKK